MREIASVDRLQRLFVFAYVTSVSAIPGASKHREIDVCLFWMCTHVTLDETQTDSVCMCMKMDYETTYKKETQRRKQNMQMQL